MTLATIPSCNAQIMEMNWSGGPKCLRTNHMAALGTLSYMLSQDRRTPGREVSVVCEISSGVGWHRKSCQWFPEMLENHMETLEMIQNNPGEDLARHGQR